MARKELEIWLKGEGDLACSVGPGDLRGFFQPHFTIPRGCLLLHRGKAGEWILGGEGDEIRELREGILVKKKPFICSFTFQHLKTRESLALTVACSLEFSIRNREFDLAQMRNRFLLDKEEVSHEDVARFLQPFVEQACADFASGTGVEELYAVEKDVPFSYLQEKLKEALFEAGLIFQGFHEMIFVCPEYDRLQEEEKEKRLEEERRRLKHDEIMTEKEMELEEMERAAEVAEKEKVLQEQLTLDKQKLQHLLQEKDLRQHFRERDLKVEDELRRFEALRKRLGDETKALLFLMEDEDARREVLTLLFEKDMTPEQIHARAPLEFQRRLDRSLKNFFSRLSGLLDEFEGGTIQRKGKELETVTQRILLASGSRVLSFDPKTNIHPEQVKEVMAFSSGTLGSIRSLRIADHLGEPHLLVGARRGVYLAPLERQDLFEEYRFPVEDATRYGTNSACIVGDTLYASHSGQGLVRWSLKKSLFSEPVYRGRGEEAKVTRGVCCPDGRTVYFSCGKDLLSFPEASPGRYTLFRGARSPVTSFVVLGSRIYGGTEDGRILVWEIGDPASPKELPVRKDKGITMVRTAVLRGRTKLLIAGKDHQILALDPEGMEMIAFSTPAPVRWVDGSSDFIAGVDSGGFRTYVFRAKDPTLPPFSIYTEERIQEVLVNKRSLGEEKRPSSGIPVEV